MAQSTKLLDLIGNTPMVKLSRMDTGACELHVKLESQNPGGSIKDRIGLYMIEAAERAGKLKPGGTIIEATAGNTGLGLALVAAQKGYRLILVIPDKMSQQKIFHLRALGAEVILTRSDVAKGHPEYYQDVAEALSKKTDNAYYINQFGNPANPEAHETATAPEIWEQMGQQLDAVVVGVGSGGTLTGFSRFFERTAPHVAMVLADPQGSILADYIKTHKLGKAGSWLVEGIGEDFIPSICDLSRVKSAYSISDSESFFTARELLQKEGILGGSSAGTLVAAALRYCREQTTPKRVVTLICDSGNKYLTKMFNDYWMAEHGFLERAHLGDLRDIVSRPVSERAAVIASPTEPMTRAYQLMKLYDISQLPIMQDGKLVGILDESDLLLAASREQKTFLEPIEKYMSTKLHTVDAKSDIESLLALFEKDMVPIVMHQGEFVGIITRIDLLNYLRRKID